MVKSTCRPAKELRRQGYEASPSTVLRLLAKGFGLQANRKTQDGKQHSHQDGQFGHIHRRVNDRLRPGEPAISVDTKKRRAGNAEERRESASPKVRPAASQHARLPEPFSVSPVFPHRRSMLPGLLPLC
jgi:hypothetical protein